METKRNYTMTDAKLTLFVSSLIDSMTRDAAEFAVRGVTASDITALQALSNAFEVFPSDEEYSGLVTIAIDEREAVRLDLLAGIRLISGFIEQKWGISSGQYKRLGIRDIERVPDENLLFRAREVVRIATEYLTVLTSIGLTQTMLDTLDDDAQLFETKMIAVNSARSVRDLKTIERIEKGNVVYSFVSKYCNIGKLIWEDTDEGKYEDYIIYKSSPVLPSKVQNLQYDISNTKLKWDLAADATNYELEVKKSDPAFSWSQIYVGEEQEFIYPSPPGNWLYRCRGINSEGVGNWSDELAVSTPI